MFYLCSFYWQDAELKLSYQPSKLEGTIEAHVVLEAVEFLQLGFLQNSRSEMRSKQPTLNKKREKRFQSQYDTLKTTYHPSTLEGMLEVDVLEVDVLEAVDFLPLALLQNSRSERERTRTNTQ